MGMTTCMKTVEVTRNKSMTAGGRVPGTLETFVDILRTQGIRGVNKGVNAVALRQITGWASRMGISKAAETPIRKLRGKTDTEKLAIGEKIAASTIGGALSCWNQPFEVSMHMLIYKVWMAADCLGHTCGHASGQSSPVRRQTLNGFDSETNLAGEWSTWVFSRRGPTHRCCIVGHHLHGWIRRHCKGVFWCKVRFFWIDVSYFFAYVERFYELGR